MPHLNNPADLRSFYHQSDACLVLEPDIQANSMTATR